MRLLADDTLIVFLSDCHIGGDPGRDIFESPDQLVSMLDDVDAHPGPVELVLAGEFFDFLRVAEVPDGENRASVTIAGRNIENCSSDCGASPRARRGRSSTCRETTTPRCRGTRRSATLGEQGLVHEFALSYSACFESEPDRIVYCEHGNQFDPANTFRDYADPLDTPLGDHVVTDLMPRLPGGRTLTPSLHLREVDRIFRSRRSRNGSPGACFTTSSGRRSAGCCSRCSSPLWPTA